MATPVETACAFFSCGPSSKTQQDMLFHIGVLLCELVTIASEGGLGGASISSGEGVPDNGVGSNGDQYTDTDTNIQYLKEGGVWVAQGQMAKSVTDSQATFVTPTAGDGTTELATA